MPTINLSPQVWRRIGVLSAGGVFSAGLLIAPAAQPAAAAMVKATPTSLATDIAAARGGDTIELTAGDYAPVKIAGRSFAPALTIKAGAVRVANVGLQNVSGLVWLGGHFDGNDREPTGLSIGASHNIRIEAADFQRFTRNGIVVGDSSDIDLVGNRLTKMGSDGIQIALSRRMTIEGNSCVDFSPSPGTHPDCIQLWSRPGAPPTADILIKGNVMAGSMQGISLFNHVRGGVDDGGFDRISVVANDVRISDYYHGIALYDCRECLVRDNKVATLAGGNPKAHAWIRVENAARAVACGNAAPAIIGIDGAGRCGRGVPQSVSQR